jgi:tetratricopeptide (TPR) repeat protein/predicted phosphodiesterase
LRETVISISAFYAIFRTIIGCTNSDLAFYGKKEEYNAAAQHFLAPVLDAAGLDKSRLFIVPGNHDLDHNSFDLLLEGIKKPLTEEKDFKEWLEDDKKRAKMLEPFEAFKEFVKDYADGSFSAYAGSYRLDIAGKKIALLGFNSALMCGRSRNKNDDEIDDKGKIMVGEPQVYDMLKKNRDADLRIVVLHHPFDWLTEQDRIPVEAWLKQSAHFILCGHQHRPKVTVETGTDGDCIMIPAGASYERRKAADQQYDNAYNFVHLDFENQNVAVYLRCWSDRGNRWREDIDVYKNGCFAFPLPKGLLAVTASPGAAGAAVKYHPDNPVFNVPFRAKGDGLVGREEALQKVREQLTAGQRTSIGHTAAFQGLGGLGKTQLAVEYAHRYRGEYPLGVIWINADQEIEPQLIQMSTQAGWIHPESKPQDILEMAKQRLQSRSDCLVIFDNVEERAAIEPYLPVVGAEPHLLLTSRAPQTGFVPIDISLLDEERSFQLLLKESGRDIGTLPEPEQKAGREIAASLGGLPLALEIAGAYLKYINTCTFQNYRDFLAENLKEAMKGNMLSSFTRHETDLFLTLQVSKPELDQAPLLNGILDILAWSGSAFMGVSLLAALLGKTAAELFTPRHLGVSLHLLQKSPEEERYDIHRLVRRVRQEQTPLAHREPWIKETCQRLGDWFEERVGEFTHLAAFEAEIDHLKQWLDHVKPYPSIHAARLTWLQAYPPNHWGKYRESHRLMKSAFALLSETSEDVPELKANILNDLGNTYLQLGEFKKALKYQMQALEIRREKLGEQHSDTANSLDNIGSSYDELKNYTEALRYKKHALGIRQQFFGEHPRDTAISLSSVGTTYNYLGSLENQKIALDYHCRALEIKKQLFGEQHPNTYTSLSNVGVTYNYLKDYEKGLEYQFKALKARQKLFGEHHPDTATSLHNIGYAYLDMGKPSEALNYFSRAFEIGRQLLGELHQKTAAALGNFVYSLIKLKRFPEAGERLEAYLDCLPQDHPEYKNLSGLKKRLQKEKIKGLQGIPGKKKKKKK